MSILLVFDSCDMFRQGRKDIFISLDQVGTEVAQKQFGKASKDNKYEILHNLLEQAELYYKHCNSLDDLNDIQDKLNVIMLWVNQSKLQSYTLINRLKILSQNISEAIFAEHTALTAPSAPSVIVYEPQISHRP